MKALIIILILVSHYTNAQFNLDGPPVMVWSSTWTDSHSISDGEGGFFVAFSSGSTAPTYADIFIQRFDANGNKLWGDKGIQVTNRSDNEGQPMLALGKTSTGSKRVVVVWHPGGLGDMSFSLLAQSYDFSGAPQWAANGVVISDKDFGAGVGQRAYDIIPTFDGTRLIVGFYSFYYTNRSIKIQSINIDNGSVIFSNNGLTVEPAVTGNRVRLAYTEDGSGNIAIVWQNNEYNSPKKGIKAQIFNPNTNTLVWAAPLHLSANIDVNATSHHEMELAGQTVTWRDTRHGNNEIYVQRFNANGTMVWPIGGKRVTNMPNSQTFPKIAQTTNRTTYLSWENSKESHTDSCYVYLTRINPDGTFPWGEHGVILSRTHNTSSSVEQFETAVTVKNDTALVFYKDNGHVRAINPTLAYLVQKVTPNGRLMYGEKGQTVAGINYYVNINSHQTDVMHTADNGFVLRFNSGYNTRLAKVIPCPTPPLQPLVTHAKVCDAGSASYVTASACPGSVNWYLSDQRTKVFTGDTLRLPSVNSTASYYASCSNNLTGCASINLTRSDVILINNSQNVIADITLANSPAKVETKTFINATNKVQESSKAIYLSKTINLNPGFEAKQGAVFTAEARICLNQP